MSDGTTFASTTSQHGIRVTLMVCLDDFPEHRRDWLLWRNAHELDHGGVDDLVTAAEHVSCPWRYSALTMTASTAVLGNDGRYHLVDGESVVCADVEPFGRWGKLPAGDHPHENTDVGGSVAPRQRFRIVRLTATTVPASLVPPAQRCSTTPARKRWPAHHNRDTSLGRQHAQLAVELGTMCRACHTRPASAIDHDHLTGLVRGLLCRHCNTNIDECLHLSGCPWADYLNNPPAAPLRLRYCQAGRRQRNLSEDDRKRIESLGFNPLA